MRSTPPLLALALLAAACARRAEPPVVPVTPPPAIAAEEGALPDLRQSLGIVIAENEGVRDRAALALERARAPRTQALARTLADDHRAVAERLADLVSRLAEEPEPTPTSRAIREEDGALLERLRAAPAATFDEAWIAAERERHERILSRLDAVLVPAAGLEEYRAVLLELRPTVAAHLEALGGAGG